MKERILSFIFPIKSPILSMTIAGILLAVHTGLSFASFDIGPMNVSMKWIIIYIAGFFLGPVFGVVFAVISDTINFFVHPSPAGWMWQYSMQEPIIALLGGLTFIAYEIVKEKDTVKSKWILFGIFETIFSSMMLFAIIYIFKNMESQNIPNNWSSIWIKWAAIALSITLYININGIVLYKTIRNRQPKLFMLVTLLVVTPYVFFSWILGVPFFITFLERSNNSNATSNYTQYGWIYYGFPRIIKSLVVVPVEIGITAPLIYSLTKLNNNTKNTW